MCHHFKADISRFHLSPTSLSTQSLERKDCVTSQTHVYIGGLSSATLSQRKFAKLNYFEMRQKISFRSENCSENGSTLPKNYLRHENYRE